MFGPALPPHMLNKSDNGGKSDKRTDVNYKMDSLQSSQKESFKRTHDSFHDEVKSKTLKTFSESPNRGCESDEIDDMYGPPLPTRIAGKQKEKSAATTETKVSSESDDDDMYVPALPPHLLHRKSTESTMPTDNKRVQGPSLPKGFVPPPMGSFDIMSNKEEESESEDDGPVIGPALPTGEFNEEEYRIRQLEFRARRMKDKLEGRHQVSILNVT